MTHASVPDSERAKLGIDDTLIRLSVGIESCRDLIDDLDKALNAAVASKKPMFLPQPEPDDAAENDFGINIEDTGEEDTGEVEEKGYWDW